jgi:murein DD-endopeptidase MepM/ murein hydrolase activator NlpD
VAYSREQLENARILLSASRRPIIRKALVEAGIVESGLHQLRGGDRDSTGILQQRPSMGWGPVGESAATDAAQFVRAARRVLGGGFRGSAGQLAQAVQRSGRPLEYDRRAGQAQALLRSVGGLGGAPGVRASMSSAGGGPGADLGGASTAATDQLASLLGQRAAPTVSAPAAPAFTAGAVMPAGYQAPQGAVAAGAQSPDVSALLDAVRTVGADVPQAGAVAGGSGGGGPVASGASVASGRYPTARTGKIIGTPYTGTHTLGNWQSDNAVDIAVPKGTPMVALQSGTVVKVRHHPQDGGRFAGDQITIRGANGNEYFYAHGVADVKPGQRVRRGESLGVTGSANGVEHLHFGQMRGDPRMHTRRR